MAPFPNIFLFFNNRVLLFLLAMSILLVPVSYFFKVHSRIPFIADKLFVYCCFSLLLLNGTFAKTKYAWLVNIGIGVLIVGVLFKIMHWPGANELLIIGFSSIFILYLFHFIMRKKYQLVFGVAKLLLLLMYLGSKLFTILHWPYNTVLQMVAPIVLFIVVGSFILLNFQKLIKS